MLQQKIKKLNSICITDTIKVFNIDIVQREISAVNINDYINIDNDMSLSILKQTYITQEDENENLYLNYNISESKGNISVDCDELSDSQYIVNNMYDTTEFFMKAAQKLTNGNNKSCNYVNVFAQKLSTNIIDSIQVNNVIYGYSNKDIYGHYKISVDIYSYISAYENGRAIPYDSVISTLLFDKTKISCGILDDAILSNIENIKYNKIFEIPGYEYNDYDSGNLPVNVYRAKNHYSSKYDMCHDNNTDIILNNTRDYVGIGTFNNTNVYLKYYDNQYYKANGKLFSKNTLLKYQHIEVLGAMNRRYDTTLHKTSVYGLDINTKITSTADNKQYLDLLKFQIKNIVKKHLKSFAPANTQLFKINIK